MKLISLNVWGGKVFNPLMAFINQELKDTDIFCFQEVFDNDESIKDTRGYRANLLEELSKLLSDFDYFYSPVIINYTFDATPKRVNFGLKFGLAVFVNKRYKILKAEDFEIVPKRFTNRLRNDSSNMPTVTQHLRVAVDNKEVSIFNFHGVPMPGNKLDTEKRIKQSTKIIKEVKKSNNPKVLVGDFNLMPWTKSIKIIEEELRNLIIEFKIQDTRGRLNMIDGKPGDQKFADYSFVSKDVKVKSFRVPDVSISDHLPMVLEIDI